MFFHKTTKMRKNKFANFIGTDFSALIKNVNYALDNAGFTRWHQSRYASYANGDIYLFLLLTARDAVDNLSKAVGIAEYVHCFANDVRRTLQIIRKNGLVEGFADALKESRYGKFYLSFPISPDVFPSPTDLKDLSDWWNKSENHTAVEVLKRGYGNQQAYSMLLFACREVIPANDYDPYSEEWKDDSCPWDYDHILPRSWFDKIAGTSEAFFCGELENSIGNLAPLPFSLNRALSDDERTPYYPYTKNNPDCSTIQKQLCIDSKKMATKKFCDSDADGSSERENFCLTTLTRFRDIYSKWFSATGLEELAKQENKRQKLFKDLAEKIWKEKAQKAEIYYVDGERQYPVKEENELDWLRPWLAVGICTEKDFISVASNGNVIQIGLRRLPDKTEIDGKTHWYRDDKVNTYPMPDSFDCTWQELSKLLKSSQK